MSHNRPEFEHDQPTLRPALKLLEMQAREDFQKLFELDGQAINRPQVCVVALSGGPDSVALLHLLMSAAPELRLIVAHMNHHARAGADADEQFVAHLSAKSGLTIEIGHFRATRQSHFEEDARKARHQWLEEVACRHEAGFIATGHTLDDQAETLLLRMARGTGPTGLAGIRASRILPKTGVTLIRPLLNITKIEILQYLGEIEQPYCFDPTNNDINQQSRAWVRHVLYPLLADRLNPALNRSLAHLAALMAEEEDGLERLIRPMFADLVQVTKDHNVIEIDSCQFADRGEPWLRRRWLRLLWQDQGWPMGPMNQQKWHALECWISQPESDLRHFIPGGLVACRMGNQVRIERLLGHLASDSEIDHKSFEENGLQYDWTWPGRLELGQGGASLEARLLPEKPHLEELKTMNPQEFAVVDASRVETPVFVRHPEDGDRFDPLGMGGKHQHVVDLLRHQGLTEFEKKNEWLVCDQKGIIWVAGRRIAERVKCHESTTQAWLLTYNRNS
jgi:tRNA(Ile)-lysidine synthase